MTQDHPLPSRGPLPYSSPVDLPRLADLDEQARRQAIRNKVDLEVNRIILHLRRKMKNARISQVAVQRMMGWKGSYLSQLFNRTKALRVEQLLIILEILDMPPHHFFYEIYSPHKRLPKSQKSQQNLIQRMRQGFSNLGEVLELLFIEEEPNEPEPQESPERER